MAVQEVRWEALQLKGMPPSPREGHTMLALDASRILLLGGGCISPALGPQQSNDMFVLDLKEGKWSHILSKGDPPTPRTGLSAIMLAGNRRVMIFGGSSMTEGYMNDVYVLDTTEWVWSKTAVKGVPPSPRDKHTACLFGSRMYVFGGFGPSTVTGNHGPSEASDNEREDIDADVMSEGSTDGDDSVDEEEEEDGSSISFTWFNDLHALDFITMEWQKLEVAGLKPSPRAAHTAFMAKITDQNSCEKDTMIVFGGRDAVGRQNDLFTLNLETLTWEKMDVKAPPPRSFHAMVLLGESQQAVCYGGLGVNGEMFAGLELLNLENMKWESLKSSSGLWPPLRGASAMVATLSEEESKLVVFGGSCSLEDGETIYYNDVYSIDLSSLVNASH